MELQTGKSKKAPAYPGIHQQFKTPRHWRGDLGQIARRICLRDPRGYAPRFQRLAQAIAAAPSIRPRGRLSHEQCEELLEFYVDGERRGENARALYPQVFKHLKTCALCQFMYDALTEAVSPDAGRNSTLVAEPRSELRFIVHATPDTAWSKQVRSSIGGAPLGFMFEINPRHLARVMAHLPQFPMRGQMTGERSLLLLDSIALGRRDVQVELWLHRSENPAYARLEISVVSSSPLPEPLRVKLRWDDHRYPASIEQGAGWIEHIPVSDLEDARVSVEFEAGQPSPSPEG